MERLGERKNISDIISLLTDKRGRLWCGTYKGLFRRNQEGFVQVNTPQKSKTALQNALPIYDIQETSTGTILVASAEGLFAYDEVQKSLRTIPAFTALVGATTIRRVRPDPFSRDFWVNVPSLGVLRCSEDGNVKEYFGFGQAIPGTPVPMLGTSAVFPMIFDNYGDLWMGGTGVLLRWKRQTGKLERLTTLANTTLTLQPTQISPMKDKSVLVSFFGVGLGYIHTPLPLLADSVAAPYISTDRLNKRLPDVQIVGSAEVNNTLWWTTQTNGVYRATYTNKPSADNAERKEFSIQSPKLMLPSDDNANKSGTEDLNTAPAERGINVGTLISDRSGGVIFDY
jgi:ligand-binding sensor domain-containing protein